MSRRSYYERKRAALDRCTECRAKTRRHHENSVGAVDDWNRRAK